MKINNFTILIVICMAMLCLGCGRSSSQEEALYVVGRELGYQKIILYFSAEFGNLSGLPWLGEANPSFMLNDSNPYFAHVVIYKTANDDSRIVLLDDSRPPKIVAAYQWK